MLNAYEKVIGNELPSEVVTRRLGDVASSVANPKKANNELNWVATLSIDDAITSSWSWQVQNPEGYLE